jgi:DNA-binding NarL/FixJ family response regulator
MVSGCRGSWSPDASDRAVLDLIARGVTVQAAARRLEVSERTVRRRLRAMAEEIGVDTTIEVVVHAVRRGML